jgi:tetratricopeptide (TPR) repeat protein
VAWALTAAATLATSPLAAQSDSRRASEAIPAKESESWATRSARRWYDRGQHHERHRSYARALDAYARALQADATFGPAYLAMGRLREQIADFDEAELIYDRAIRLPVVAAEALARRAVMRRKLGRLSEALRDIEAAVQTGTEEPRHLELGAQWYVEARNWSAALAWHRRLESALRGQGDTQRADQVHLQVRALVVLAGDTDPVSAGRDHPSWVRRSLATLSL